MMKFVSGAVGVEPGMAAIVSTTEIPAIAAATGLQLRIARVGLMVRTVRRLLVESLRRTARSAQGGPTRLGKFYHEE